MPTQRDYYEILAVSRDADGRTIKSAYRKLAVKYHPDRNPGDGQAEEKFKEAAEAYSVLSDAEKKVRYDRFGHQGVGGTSGFDPDTFGDFADILGDFFGAGFGDLFGGRRRRGPGRPGADLRYRLELSLEQAASGTVEQLEIPRLEACEDCSGSGSAGGGQPTTCSACRGQGQVRITQGFFTVARACPQCRGEGQIITDPCEVCKGQRRVQKHRKVEVKIPPGVDNGTRLRLRGEGEHGVGGGPTGDLYVDVLVTPHDRFVREGPHVLSEQLLSYPQAVLGTSVEVETLHGKVPLDVPPGTAQGKDFRLRGQGIDRLDGRGRGDHVVRIAVDVPHPRRLSDEQLTLLQKFAEVTGDPVRQDKGVLDRVRDLFG